MIEKLNQIEEPAEALPAIRPKTWFQPGIIDGWLPVLMHPIKRRNWLIPMLTSMLCWIDGHNPQDQPVYDVTNNQMVISCKDCGMQILVVPAGGGDPEE